MKEKLIDTHRDIGGDFLLFDKLAARFVIDDLKRSIFMLVHAVDIFWLVMPTLSPEGVPFHWTLIPAFVGIGGLAVAFGVWRVRGRFTVPVRDPYLADSLAYKGP